MLGIDEKNPIVKLCAAGTECEKAGKIHEAGVLYSRAWESCIDDAERCIAAHYIACFLDLPELRLYWSIVALEAALSVDDERVQGFYAVLFLSVAETLKDLERLTEAAELYRRAEEATDSVLGLVLPLPAHT